MEGGVELSTFLSHHEYPISHNCDGYHGIAPMEGGVGLSTFLSHHEIYYTCEIHRMDICEFFCSTG
eukprot:6192545-Pleurochrysis_carterae.AAC.4